MGAEVEGNLSSLPLIHFYTQGHTLGAQPFSPAPAVSHLPLASKPSCLHGPPSPSLMLPNTAAPSHPVPAWCWACGISRF